MVKGGRMNGALALLVAELLAADDDDLSGPRLGRAAFWAELQESNLQLFVLCGSQV